MQSLRPTMSSTIEPYPSTFCIEVDPLALNMIFYLFRSNQGISSKDPHLIIMFTFLYKV